MLFLVLAFVVAPIVEIGVFVEVGRWIGYGPALLVLVAISIVGVWVVKRQGTGVLRRMRSQIAAGQVPAIELIDGVLLLVAGALLIVPGFVSDVVGLVLLMPPARRVPSAWVRRRTAVRIATGVGGVGTTVAARSREWRASKRPPEPPALGE